MANKRLLIGSWNLCNGLCNKVIFVKQLLYQRDLDVLFLQETEIPQQYDLRSLSVDGYVTEFCNSTDKVRLVAYIKSDILYTRVNEEDNTNV